MQPEEIKQAVSNKGFTLKLIAEVIGKHHATVGNVISRKAISKPIALAICKVIEEPIEHVFPDVPKYHVDTDQSYQEKKQALTRLLSA